MLSIVALTAATAEFSQYKLQVCLHALCTRIRLHDSLMKLANNGIWNFVSLANKTTVLDIAEKRILKGRVEH